ncbi:MAG: DUF1501 domain-containing protein [Planctomycetes bacterium]|nr:DUF1501 domain-containing protein [Planctomycetota bacterium]
MSTVHSTLGRRQLLQLGGLSTLGLNLGGLLRAQAAPTTIRSSSLPKIRACIVVFYYGGPSHLDTFDVKPNAPSEVRGEFKPIATSVPGVSICEHMPHTAKVMHHVALVRSMHHTNRLHDSASTEALTGRQSPQGDREEFATIPQFYPCHGATLSYMRQHETIDVPHAALPWVFHNVVDVPCQGGGFLGAAFDPFRIGGDPSKVSYSAEMFARPADLSIERLTERRALAERLATDPTLDTIPASRELKALYGKAIELMQSEAVARALRIDDEPQHIRERYGLYPGPVPEGVTDIHGRQLRGQNLLLARRLVEAGVPFVNVYDFRQQGQNWDSHANNFSEHKDRLLPPADQAFAALVEDLASRGLLESTLVVAMGEFGRTPKINGNAGRDHWPDCYSIALAGGGVSGGAVFGASDHMGAYPAVDPVTPADLAATIFWRFGIDPRAVIRDVAERPHRLADGKPLTALFA